MAEAGPAAMAVWAVATVEERVAVVAEGADWEVVEMVAAETAVVMAEAATVAAVTAKGEPVAAARVVEEWVAGEGEAVGWAVEVEASMADAGARAVGVVAARRNKRRQRRRASAPSPWAAITPAVPAWEYNCTGTYCCMLVAGGSTDCILTNNQNQKE